MTQTPPRSTSRTLYPGKGKRVQGILSKDGGVLFERVRTALRRATGRHHISDSDCIDFSMRCAKFGAAVTLYDLAGEAAKDKVIGFLTR